MLIMYIFFLNYICVLSRPYSINEPRLMLFSSYRAAWRGNFLFPFAQYNFANILIYIPVGILTCACFIRDTDQQEKTGVKHWVREDKATIFTINSWILLLVATLLGLIVSSIVETLQLYLCKGTFEIDDLLNNAVGAFIGASWVVKKADYSTSKILEFINFIWIICFLVLFIRAGYLQAVHR